MHLELSKLNDGKTLSNSRKSVKQKETLSKATCHLKPNYPCISYPQKIIHVYSSPSLTRPVLCTFAYCHTFSCSLAKRKATHALHRPAHLLAVSIYILKLPLNLSKSLLSLIPTIANIYRCTHLATCTSTPSKNHTSPYILNPFVNGK